MHLTDAITGYTLYAQARRLSAHTLADYANTYRKLLAHLGDRDLAAITAADLQGFLAAQTAVSPKTLLNYHTGLAALYTWLVSQSIVPANLLHGITRPKPQKHEINPLTKHDLHALLASLDRSKPYRSTRAKPVTHRLPAALRNRALILLLLDTGARADEIASAAIADLDLRNRHLLVRGKGNKTRTLPYSPRTGEILWRYLATRRDEPANRPLFATETRAPMTRDRLLKTLKTIGERAGVPDCHPHRFRHTFAINYLRNGGDPWTLQAILGHTTMHMVKRYLQLAQADLDARHRLASPVENWNL